MRSRSAWVAASSCVLLVAGCGGSAEHRSKPPPPRIPADVAQLLAGDADSVAATQGCAARPAVLKLQADVIEKSRRIPQRYREQLVGAVNGLVFRVPECLPPKKDHGKHKGQKKHRKHDEND